METWNDSQRTDVFTLNEDPVSANVNNSSDVPSLNTNDEVVDMGADFDFEGFQVVRREFFAHLREPAVTFNNYKFYVNCACLNKFPDAFYVQVLVNQETKIMALRPCAENTRDSFAWCGMSKGKRSPRQITCKLFFAKMFSMPSPQRSKIHLHHPMVYYFCTKMERLQIGNDSIIHFTY